VTATADLGLGLKRRSSELPLPLRWLGKLWWFARKKPLGAVGGVMVATVLFAAVFAPALAPYGFSQQNLRGKFQAPSQQHVMGTDELGRDIYTRILYGARVSVTVGFSVVVLSVIFSVTVGMLTGYFGGWFDTLAQRGVDIWLSFPELILLITIISVFGIGLSQLIFALAIGRIAGSSRVFRGLVLTLKQNAYLESARALGAGNTRIMLRHLLPNLMPYLIFSASIGLGGAILAESSLSFLGLGVPPPNPTWGGMLNKGRNYVSTAPHMVIWPFFALALAVFGFNVLGDALRDVLDPRLRGSK
jgi:peptide/nickel transport system permease protein